MKYKVLIKKCDNPDTAAQVATKVAQWSGNTATAVMAALLQKSVCIKKEADEAEAFQLKQEFEAVGAEVELEKLAPPPPVAAPAPTKKAVKTAAPDDNDDEDDVQGRILTPQEYAERAASRKDIFVIDKDKRIRNFETIFLAIGIAAGVWLTTHQVVVVATDFFEKMPEERGAKLVTNLPETLQKEDKKAEEEKKKQEDLKTDKKTMEKSKSKGAGGRTGGGGDPRARVTQKGVLGIISGRVKGKTVASADIFGKGGFASGIDGILQGVGGLAAGGSGGVGRKGAAGIGFGAGYGSGFGGGSGGVDDLLGSLMGSDGSSALNLKKRGSLQISAPDFVKGAALTGGRSKASIMRVVMQNIAALRYAYNQRLREKPGLKGKVTVKFAIDEFGKVIFCEVVESTMGDSEFDQIVAGKIKRWVFEKIDKPGDVTEVVYPFVFSQ